MKEEKVTDRLAYLAEQFDVFDCFEEGSIEKKLKELAEKGYSCRVIDSSNGGEYTRLKSDDSIVYNDVIAISSAIENEKGRLLRKVSVCSSVFSEMIQSDPTINKIYLQWMLTIFSQMIKTNTDVSINTAIRLVNEDLPQANTYLTLFDGNKFKKKFLDLCKGSYTLKHVLDPTNINQYKSLAQLFDAIDPFIEKEPSAVERTLYKFVENGQAEIPVRDRRFTLYIPKTTAASEVFAKFANWCTAREGNGMFNSYTNNNKKPNGKNSDIYIIIDNKFFTGESENMFQIHFETGQLKDRKNGQNVSIFENVLSESDGITNYFYEELMSMAKSYKKGIETNKYLDYLIQFGFAESLFELIDEQTPTIRFMTREIPRLPDISKFKNLDQLIITGAKMVELHPSVGKLSNLEMLVLTENNIKSLPKEIGSLTKLAFLNLIGNPINEFPNEIKYLDKSNGGSLHRLAVKAEDIGDKNYQKLKELLPTTFIN